MEVFAAFRSVPDYSAPSPSLKSLHLTLDGAILSLYPDGKAEFRKWAGHEVWEGPDGFGLIKKMEVENGNV